MAIEPTTGLSHPDALAFSGINSQSVDELHGVDAVDIAGVDLTGSELVGRRDGRLGIAEVTDSIAILVALVVSPGTIW